jgi:hypothetical protein
MNDKIYGYFRFDHLPPHLQAVSKPFAELAAVLLSTPCFDQSEREVALRKLLESKDAAVRSAVPLY